MKIVIYVLLMCMLLILPSAAKAVDITVGTMRLAIPSPDGFQLVTPEMERYAAFSQHFVPPSNEQFVQFLSENDATLARQGMIPPAIRRCYVQTSKPLVEAFMTVADFAEFKQSMKAQNAEIVKKIPGQTRGFFEKTNEGVLRDESIDLGLKLDQMVPLAPHYESDRAMAVSMLVRLTVNDEKGDPSVREGYVTTAVVHVQGKVLYLYVNSEKSGLEWSRAHSQKWTEAIIAANPSTGDIAARENAGPTRRRSPWSRILQNGAVGAAIGGTFGLVAYVRKKITGRA